LIALLALLFAGAVGGAVIELTQCASEIFDLAFVGELLPFGNFDEFQHFFHLIHGALEDINNGHHFINRLMDGGHAMLRLDAGDALGQPLNAFDERAWRLGRTTRRERFGCRAFGTRRTLAAFYTGWLRRLLCCFDRGRFWRDGRRLVG
jgi:hypothetical protein